MITRIVRIADPSGRTFAGIVLDDRVELHDTSPLELLGGRREPTGSTLTVEDPQTLAVQAPYRLLPPVDAPEVWAAGVTYERSRQARRDETEVADVYSLVYDAERPELFLKDAGGRRTVGPHAEICVRSDSAWTVPEAEVALVLSSQGEILALTAGNDVTARDLEAKNPLYLPQAKLFTGACALGPSLVPADAPLPLTIELVIRASDGTLKFSGTTSTALLRRSFAELAAFAVRDNPIPHGAVLLTGTGIVPPDEIALKDADVVEVTVDHVGTLRTPVRKLP